jgi:hypothetical protein
MKTGLLWFDDDPKRTLEEKVLPRPPAQPVLRPPQRLRWAEAAVSRWWSRNPPRPLSPA